MAPRSLLVLWLLALAGAQEELPDDECDAAESGGCALHALQQRASAKQAVAVDSSVNRSAWGPSCRLYGCAFPYNPHWACQCNPFCSHYGNCCWDYSTVCYKEPSRRRMHRRGSCADFGCGSGYVRGQSCQCNPSCEAYGNCCKDYEAVCRAPPAPAPVVPAPVVPVLPTLPPAVDNSSEGNFSADAVEAVNASVNVSGKGAWGMYWAPKDGPPSCKQFGCRGYTEGLPCQCDAKSRASPGCSHRGDCCSDFSDQCEMHVKSWEVPKGTMVKLGVRKVYHQTDQESCAAIMKSEFRPGSGGYCGPAIYFAATPMDTKGKAISKSSHAGCMLEVTVDLGNALTFPCCMYCGAAHNKHVWWWTPQLMAYYGIDSLRINPGDGDEFVIYEPKKVLNITEIPWDEAWRAKPGSW